MAHNIWLLDIGAAGHYAQVSGTAAMLARAGLEIRTTRIAVAPRIRGWMRGGLKSLVSRAPRPWSQGVLHRLHPGLELPQSPPAMILGSGGDSAWALRMLGTRLGVPTCYVGSNSRFPRDWFTLCLSPVASGPEEADTGFLISEMTPRQAQQAAIARFGGPAPGLWTLLIGGRSRSHHFTENDWQELAEGVNARARRDGIRWLVSTSPRTGAGAEAILAARLAPEALADLVLWGRKPDKCAAAFLGAAERVFVTRDSLTMLSEAIAGGRPVTALTPRESRFDKGDLARSLARMREREWIAECPCAALGHAPLPLARIDPDRLAERERGIVALLAPYLQERAG